MMKRVIHIRPHWCERVPSSQWMCHHRCMTYTPSLPSLSGSPTSSPSPTRLQPYRRRTDLCRTGLPPIYYRQGNRPSQVRGPVLPRNLDAHSRNRKEAASRARIPGYRGSPSHPAPPQGSRLRLTHPVPLTASAYVLGKNWHFTYRIVHESIKSCSLPSAIASARRMRPSGQAVQGNSTGRRSILCPRRPSPSKT